MEKWAEQLAGALYQRGIRQQDRVIVYMPHCPQWIISWLAIQRLGAICVPVTHFYGPKDLKYIANDSGAQTIFCMDTNFGYVDKVMAGTKLKTVIVSKIGDYLPGWKNGSAEFLTGFLMGNLPSVNM
jgi:long-chain acyl-CoA synthetase